MSIPETAGVVGGNWVDLSWVSRGLFGVAVVGVVLSTLSPDPLLSLACAITPLVLVYLAGRNTPLSLYFVLLFQWAQVASRLLVGIVEGEPLARSWVGADLERAALYALLSLGATAVGIRIALLGVAEPSAAHRSEHHTWGVARAFRVYLVVWAVVPALGAAVLLVPPLAQPLIAFAQIKIVVLFLLFVTVLSQRRGYVWLYLALGMEVVAGFTGFFSNFKEPFFALLLAMLAARVTLRATQVIGGIVAATALLTLGIFWTSVKGEYRQFVSADIGAQSIVVPLTERITWLAERALAPGEIAWSESAEALLRRVAYIDFFGASIGTSESTEQSIVASNWRAAILHVVRPRFLFSDKDILDDNVALANLTRLEVDTETARETSISVGYAGENFADFGFPGMLVPALAIGLLLGGMARYFITRAMAAVSREAFVLACVLNSVDFGQSLPKLLGGTLVVFIALVIAARYLYPFARDRLRAGPTGS